MAGNVARKERETKPAQAPVSRPYRIEEQVGYLLRRAHQRASAIFQVTIGDPNITPTQYSSLVKLHEYTELWQNHLGRLVGMDKATMQGVVRRLKERRLVEAVRSEVSAHIVRVRTMPTGVVRVKARRSAA